MTYSVGNILWKTGIFLTAKHPLNIWKQTIHLSTFMDKNSHLIGHLHSYFKYKQIVDVLLTAEMAAINSQTIPVIWSVCNQMSPT